MIPGVLLNARRNLESLMKDLARLVPQLQILVCES